MGITYTSPHHSKDDPGGLIRETLDMGADFPGPARDALLSWILRLGDDADAAVAAKTLLARYGYAEGPVPDGACGELVMLLRETATYPDGQLRTHLCRPRSAHRRRRRRAKGG